MKPEKKTKKRLLWGAAAAAALLAAGLGIWLAAGTGGEPVPVYSFDYLGMTEYWGDSRESYGPVTTDQIQTVFLSQTQTVTEVLVKEGDTVKKGDVLMTFDTTLDSLALERKRLDVEKLKLQQTAAKERLTEIAAMVPMELPDMDDIGYGEEEPDRGVAMTDAYRFSTQSAYHGSSPETAMICWLNSKSVVNDQLLEALREHSALLRLQSETRQQSYASEIIEEVLEEVEEGIPEEPWEEPEELPEEMPESPEIPQVPVTPPDVDSYYVVFKITAENMSLGAVQTWQGVQVFGDAASGFALKFFPAAIPDHTLAVQEDGEENDEIFDSGLNSGYTAAQIAEMRSMQEQKILKLSQDIRLAEAEYKIMQEELSDGHVYAKIDGEVVSLLEEEEARENNHPILKVSCGGGFYIEGSVGELELGTVRIGQKVTVNDWNTGMVYDGEIVELRDFPSDRDSWNGSGNPNVSYYPFRVFVEGSADLQEGSYVSVMYSASAAENGIYLDNAFLRTEQGRSYVYVRDAGGKLEKRYVAVGKSLWGSYTEILEGITPEDFLAFPYGKDLKDGAPTREADISELYTY